jgi:hypothetical protein
MRISPKLVTTALILGLIGLSGCGSAESDDGADASGQPVKDSQSGLGPSDGPTNAGQAEGGGEAQARAIGRKPSRSEQGRKSQTSPQSTDAKQDSPNGSTEPSEPAVDPVDLDTALLTLDDMPARWTTQPPNKDDGASNVCGDDLQKALAHLPKAEATYALDPDHGPQVAETIGLVDDRGRELMSLVARTMAECDGKQIRGLPISTSEVPFADVGDDAHAYRVQLHYAKTDSTFDFGFGFVSADDMMLVLFTYDFTTGNDPIDMLDEYAPIAVDNALAAQ